MDDDDPRIVEVQKEINSIEEWMIGKGIKKNGITQWTKFGKITEIYPHHTGYVRFEDIHMVAELNGLGINYNQDGSIHTCTNCK